MASVIASRFSRARPPSPARASYLAHLILQTATADAPSSLWINEFKTYHGLDDRVSEEEADKLATSLYLLSLESISFSVFAPGATFGNPKRRVHIRASATSLWRPLFGKVES